MSRTLVLVVLAACSLWAEVRPGLVLKEGRPLFPIGIYELPQADSDLTGMAEAGINLVRCYKKSDLDRMAAAGLMGWIPAPLELGADEKVRQAVEGGEFITRLRPLEVKVFATSRKWETPRRAGREFAQ